MTDRRAHPLIFSAPMILAALDGRKRQTRRVVTPHNSLIDGSGKGVKAHWEHLRWDDAVPLMDRSGFWVPCRSSACDHALHAAELPPQAISATIPAHVITPRYQVGDLVWGKETHRFYGPPNGPVSVEYAADYDSEIAYGFVTWRSPLYMPRAFSRFERPIVRVGAERVQGISEEDARWEGVGLLLADTWPDPTAFTEAVCKSRREGFRLLWNSINGKKPGRDWASNPPVFVVEWETLR